MKDQVRDVLRQPECPELPEACFPSWSVADAVREAQLHIAFSGSLASGYGCRTHRSFHLPSVRARRISRVPSPAQSGDHPAPQSHRRA